MRILITGGVIVTEEETFEGDILVEDGKILEVTRNEKDKLTFHRPSSATGSGLETPSVSKGE